MKLLSLFSGIGAFECALKRCGIPFELAAFCECDKHASEAYSLIHGESADKNLGDIRSAACSRFFGVDCVCYGFPCQDISAAGHQRGFSHNGARTRSGLFFEAARIIRESMPKIAIAENVKALTSKKFKAEFDIVLGELSAAGYVNYWAVLNARDFGLPQNRERVFIVSIRADINAGFEFPDKLELTTNLKNILEINVDNEYYLKNDAKKFFINNSLAQENKGNGFRFAPHIKNNAYIAKTITTRSGGRMDDNFILEADIDTSDTNFVFNKKNINLVDTFANFKIRKLTPLECWRLQGFTDAEFERAKNGGISNPQLYKMAGNSIAVPVLCAIFEKLRRYFD